MSKRKQSLLAKIWRVLWCVLLLFILFLFVLRFAPFSTSSFILQSDYPVQQDWISIDELPSHVPLAFVSSEDQRFPDHFGVDFTAIMKAISQYEKGDGLRGASTITQQTAKNVFLWSERSVTRKVLEAGLAISLEALWGKKRILEVYVNIAEFGKGIYGVEAASQHYFGKSAHSLSKNQAAKLAIMLPSPRTRNPNNLTFYLRERIKWVERQMRQLGSGHLKSILSD